MRTHQSVFGYSELIFQEYYARDFLQCGWIYEVFAQSPGLQRDWKLIQLFAFHEVSI